MAQLFHRRSLLLTLVLLPVLGVGGCKELDRGTQGFSAPSMYFNLGSPPRPHISQVEVTNSAGKILMSGRLSSQGDLNSDPSLADLDGNLTIKSTWSDGLVTTQMITHTPNTRISLTYNNSQHGFVVQEIPSSSATGYTRQTAPVSGTIELNNESRGGN